MLNESKLKLLTEDDVRRIVRQELDSWQQDICRQIEETPGGEG